MTLETAEDSGRLGFTFRLAGGNGLLTLGKRTFFGWLHLDRLELDVPNLRLPVDLATGPEAFQRHRTRARSAALRMLQADLDRFIAGRARALEELGVEELRLLCGDGSLGLSGRVREAGHAADFTARLFADADGERLRIACARAIVYGNLPTPAPLLAHRILAALVDTAEPRAAEPGTIPPPFAFAFSGTTTASGTHPGFATTSLPGTGRHEIERENTAGPWASAVRGLGQVDLDPLALTLWHVLPTAGWRLPDTRGLAIADVRLGTDGLQVGYRPGPLTAADDDESATSHSARMPESAILFDSLDRLREADDRLVQGDALAAMRLYRTRLASHADDEPLLLERMLAVGASRRELHDDTAELASRALARWPDFAPAQAALASIAVARGDVQGAGARYRTLSQIAVAAGDREAAALAAMAGARLLRRTSPAESTPLYERALELAPGHGEASEALADRYTEERRFGDLVALLRARAAAAPDLVRRARDHVRVASILVAEMGDPVAARRELDAATHIDPHNPAAHEVMAEIDAAEGRPADGAEALQRAARIYQDRRDRRGRTRALLRSAAMLELAGDRERAEAGYRAVLELAPGEPAALRGAALAAGSRGEHAAAARMWRQLVSLSAGTSADAARDSLELARCLLASGDAGEREAAESALRRAAAAGGALVAADAHELLATRARGERRLSEATAHLAQAIEALSIAQQSADPAAAADLRSRAARLALARAVLLVALDRADAATAEYERAFALSSEAAPVRLEAAAALSASAAARRDRDGERHWIAAQLAHPAGPDGTARAELLVRRAELAMESGEDLAAALVDLDSMPEGTLPAESVPRALALRAELLGSLGDTEGRARALDRALVAAPPGPERVALAVEASQARLHAGEAGAALERVRVAVSGIDAGDAAARAGELRPRAMRALGEAAFRAREWPEVERAYRELLELVEGDPARSEWARRLGVARESTGDPEGAAAAFEACMAEPSTTPEVRVATWRSLAALYEHTADLGRAAAAYESFASDRRAEVSEANRADAWYRAGDLYRKTGGREADALRCLEAALQLAPDHLPALDVLERIERDAGDWDRMAVILGRKIAATARQPGSQKSLLVRLAQLQEERLGRTDVARETYGRALAIDPDYRPALRYVARDARARGDIETAAVVYARLASTLPGDAELSGGATAAARAGGAPVDELTEERTAAALELAALATASVAPGRADSAATALRRALEAQPGHKQLTDALTALDEARAEVDSMMAGVAEDAVTDPRPIDPHADTIIEARDLLAAGDPTGALSILEAIDRDRASDALLELRAQIQDARGDQSAAIDDLEAVRVRAAERHDAATELRVSRRLAALAARQHDEDRRAVSLYQRVLTLDPDDLTAAEACAEIFSRRREHDLYRSALVRVLEVARRGGGARAREVSALRELAWISRSQGDLAAAAEHLDQALAIDPTSFDALRERADLASEQGEPERAASSLERLVAHLEHADRAPSGAAGTERKVGDRLADRPIGPAAIGEVYLELADLYYDKIDDVPRARASMRRAAEVFGRGVRREATLRLLASEAAATSPEEAADALEAIAPERLGPGDRITLAKCYQRLGHDRRAVGLLEAAQSAGTLSDEGALLLFALHRTQHQKQELAGALERAAAGAPTDEAAARLREALGVYRDALGDEAGVRRCQEQLGRLDRGEQVDASAAPVAAAQHESLGLPESGLDAGLRAARDLENAGHLDAAAARYESLWSLSPTDLRPLEALERLYLYRGDADAVSEIIGRMIVATDERKTRAGLWFRRAKLYRDLLHREAEAYRCLKEAFANQPDSGDIAHALRSIAMARGEWGLAAELVYREIAATEDQRERAALFNELGLIFDEKLLDAEQAMRCYEQALALDPEIPAAPRPLAHLYELAGRHTDAAAMFERAAQHARSEEDRDALRRQSAASAAPLSGQVALGRAAMLEVRLAETRDPEVAADLRRQLIDLATAAGDHETVERHAAALLAEDNADLSAFLALKTQATTTGNWRTVAELLQVRAGAVADTTERAALLVDLGRLFDRQVGDRDAAAQAYEGALSAVPDHPAAIEALAELAYLRGDWLRARDLYGRLDPSTSALPPDVLHLRRGEINEVLGRDDEACAAFTEAVRLHPANRQALTALSRTALRIGDLSSAAAASRALLDLIPPDDVRAVRAARLQLAELNQRIGDLDGAIHYYELVLSEEPKSITALSALLGLYGDLGDYPSAARALRSLISLTPAPSQRAELLFQLGELCRRGLGDPDLAADSYLKAIDLDPDHLPTLVRLLEYYWQTGDQKNLLDVGRDLDRRGGLMDATADVEALGGLMLIASLRDAIPLAVRVAGFLGNTAAPALASALVEECQREGAPMARNLASAAAKVCNAAGIDAAAVRADLERLAPELPFARDLINGWPAARG